MGISVYDPGRKRAAKIAPAAPAARQTHADIPAGPEHAVHADNGMIAMGRLLPTAEECANLDDAVEPTGLMQAVERLLAGEPGFSALMPADGARHDLLRIFLALPLAPPLAYKLTVARDERAEILDHSLRVAYCAAALAEHCRMAHHEIVNAAAAGLFHDLGLLHVDPALLASTVPLTERERHYLYAHPLTGFLILDQSPIWHPVVSNAVLEHHERIDGSGYPKGLTGDKLSPLGQLLAVAELAATLLGRGGFASRERLGIVLRMNEGKLNHEYCNHLLAMFPPTEVWGGKPRPEGATLEALVGLSIAFMRWQAIGAVAPHAPLAVLIDHRMGQLGHALAEVGVDIEYWSTFSSGADRDTTSLAEMEVAAHEGLWQLHAIANEVRRRWEHLADGSEPIAAAVREWLDAVERVGAT